MPNKVIEKFTVEIDANQQKFKAELKRSEQDAKKFSQNIKRSFASIAKGGVIAGAGLAFLTKKVIETSSSMQQLKTQLATVTGSVKAADDAFKIIKDFASETPFQIEELVDSFVKLKALGLDPSEEALMSYGNTAAAMGKSLNQMIEAVADASVGEFERLKEFGIKSKSEGDKVSFTFQGVTKTVGKNAAEITEFLQGIGNVNFAGAMERQANTLAGAFSNLQDAITQALTVEGEELDMLSSEIRELTDLLKDPETIKAIQTLTSALVTGFAGAVGIIADVTNGIRGMAEEMARAVHGAADISGALSEIEEQFDRERFLNVSTANLDKNIDLLKSLIGFSSADELESNLKRINTQISETRSFIERGIGGKHARENMELEIAVLEELRDITLGALDAKEQFSESDAAAEVTLGLDVDQFDKDLHAFFDGVEKQIDDRQKLFASTESSLRKQVELYGEVSEAAKIRYDIENGELKKLTEGQQEVLVNLAVDLDNQNAQEENKKVIDLQDEKFKRMRDAALEAQGLNRQLEEERFAEELAMLEEERARILEMTMLTEQQKADIKAQFQQAELDAAIIHAKNLTDIEKEEADKRNAIKQAQLDAAGNFFGLLGNLAKEGSKAQRVAFAAEKAVAIAKSLMNLQVAISNASALPPPANFIAMAQAAATGAGIIANVRSVAVAHGGLDLGNLNLRQDELTVIAQRGERILSRDQNKDVTDMAQRFNDNRQQASGGDAQQGAAPNVAFFMDPEAAVNFVASDRGGQAVMQHIAFNKDEINSVLGRG